MSSEISGIHVFVGSTNPTKVRAAHQAVGAFHSGVNVVAIPVNANPGITAWRSSHAVGQPFGSRQTAFGAINRMMDCWSTCQEPLSPSSQNSPKITYVVGKENGLISSSELGKKVKNWFDICYVAVRDNDPDSSVIIKRGEYVQTEFDAPENGDQQTFDAAVKRYEELILPKIALKRDLYLGWTADHPEGPKTREYFLSRCLTESLIELSYVKNAKKIIDGCVEAGMSASVGPRYQNMLWTRDLAYMAPVYLQRGYLEEFRKALGTISIKQNPTHFFELNGYEALSNFGAIPIVCIAKENESSFLRQRLRGSLQDPYWQIQLWNYCSSHQSELLPLFPKPQGNSSNAIESLTLTDCPLDALKEYYHDLLAFQEKLKMHVGNNKTMPPSPSFALRSFMTGQLENITPGTRDSEIHFIRSFFFLIESSLRNKQKIFNEFSVTLGEALFYLYMNVLDEQDGLPRGADSRDIFADILYDAKVLSNAVFWYQALSSIQKYAKDIDQTLLRCAIAGAIHNQEKLTGTPKKIPSLLSKMANYSLDLSSVLSEELNKLRTSIQNRLLFTDHQFAPRDFIPGNRAKVGLDSPIQSTPITSIIKNDNPAFIDGKDIDPQSLSHAVLNNLIPAEYYDEVINLFATTDTPIGVSVFVPISGKTEEETLLLRKVKGRVVWPHVTWNVVLALLHMNTPRSLNMAEEQRDKLMKLGGCSEWYAIDPDTQRPVQGGDPQQGWAASGMIAASKAFYDYYRLALN